MYVSGTGKEKEEKLADGHGFKGVKRVSGVVQRVLCVDGKSRPRGGVCIVPDFQSYRSLEALGIVKL